MKTCLVGYSGFVGSNLNSKFKFDNVYNSSDIEKSYGTKPDLLVYSGVPAQKFLANNYPEKDFEVIKNAINNIKLINPKKIVLISTIDIYKNPVDVNEESEIIEESLEAYGKNRYYLENWVKENFEDYLIVRLPGLYGKNIKKNFIFDLINIVPSLLSESKFNELTKDDNYLCNYYNKKDNGFYGLKEITKEEKINLKKYFNDINFSALNFTDSRGSYQFYNLEYLWKHIEIALSNNIKILNLATEPVKISELYNYIKGETFNNELNGKIADYNFKTLHDKLFNGENGYILKKEFILEDIKKFVEENENE